MDANNLLKKSNTVIFNKVENFCKHSLLICYNFRKKLLLPKAPEQCFAKIKK